MKNRPVGAALVHGIKWTDGRIAMTMAIGAFRDYTQAPKIKLHPRLQNVLYEYIWNKF
jgi:hypothetical protein